ncbi:MAG TPA: Gfo/Idh/MocA family oxidoreductase [Pseudonocardiaceae bacterium]|nr:Gfo/Idh/MocA family oxidoreductase [Pseudonocardiaceae bacterium]
MSEPLRVGLIGAGPWARQVHAPAIAGHRRTELVSVWARRPAAAQELAAEYDTAVAADPDELIAAVDVVAFAVPPTVQGELAVRAAAAGRHLILEKPLAGDLPAAQLLADTVGAADVTAVLFLTSRYAQSTVDWLAQAARLGGWVAGGGRWFAGSALSGPFAGSAWRRDRGALLDVGPHVLDLLDAALGPIVDVLAAHHSRPDLWQLLLAHDQGSTSAVSLSLRVPADPSVVEVALYGPHGTFPLPHWPTSAVDCFSTLLDQLHGLVTDQVRAHPCDVQQGLRLQRVIETAELLAAES